MIVLIPLYTRAVVSLFSKSVIEEGEARRLWNAPRHFDYYLSLPLNQLRYRLDSSHRFFGGLQPRRYTLQRV